MSDPRERQFLFNHSSRDQWEAFSAHRRTVSSLLGDSPVADVVALRAVRCLFLAGPGVEGFLVANPRVMYRMLQAQARRLRNANRWRS